MHSLVMSSCSRDLIVLSLVVKLIGTWFLVSEVSTCDQQSLYTSCGIQFITLTLPFFHLWHEFFKKFIGDMCEDKVPQPQCLVGTSRSNLVNFVRIKIAILLISEILVM